MATKHNPAYTVYVVSGSTKYDITPALISVGRSEKKKQMAQSVTIQLADAKVGSERLSALLKVRDRVFVHANDGSKNDEVWRGYLWTRSYKGSINDRVLQFKCYDNLIYLQESEESLFFASGKATKDVCQSVCDKWGIKLNYSYESIEHTKLVLRGYLSDIFTEDILDLVKDRTGTKYVILSDKDIMYIKPVGSNDTIYHFIAGQNIIQMSSECTMDGMTTKVVIVGKADSDDREPVEATVTGQTSTYGTLQKIISRSENTSLADAKKEAQEIIDEDGKPKWEYQLTAPDIPWIRLGDKVYVNAGDFTGYLIVTGIDRDCDNKKKEMTLTMEKP